MKKEELKRELEKKEKRSGSRVKGAYMPVEIFARDGRKYNRWPLYSATRKTLRQGSRKESLSAPCHPARAGLGGAQRKQEEVRTPEICETQREISSEGQP